MNSVQRAQQELSDAGMTLVATGAFKLLESLNRWAATREKGRAGIRIYGDNCLREFLDSSSVISQAILPIIGERYFPVRAILFDKSVDSNWALSWHQDRTICVQTRSDVIGFGPWSTKDGLLHVEPPYALLSKMHTIRVHIDDVDEANGPLLVSPGSHRVGRIEERDIEATVASCGTFTCLSQAGDIWIYPTPILHASRSAANPRRRRVLHVDYANEPLPDGLNWLGI